jgi:hypothetical protein
MQKIRITRFFFENRLHWQFEMGKKFSVTGFFFENRLHWQFEMGKKVSITGFFFENRLHWQFEMEKNFSINGCFRPHIYLHISHYKELVRHFISSQPFLTSPKKKCIP